MNYKRTAAVLMFMAALSFSMFMVPVGFVANTGPASSPQLPVETQEQLNEWYETLAQPGFTARIDPLLADWGTNGKLSANVVSDLSGNPNALVFMAPWADEDAIRELVHVKWSVDLKAMKTMMVSISSQYALEELSKISGVGYIEADMYLHDAGDDLVKNIHTADPTPGVGPDMYQIRETVKATGTTASGYNGSGVIVGHIDTGADFGNPDLQHAYDWDYAAFDPSGFGLTPTFYHANSTPVNVTEWTASPYNLLTYEADGKYYVDVSDWDPITNMNGVARYLIGDGSYDAPYNQRVGFIWLYAYFWGIDGLDTMLDYIWQDIEVPAPAALHGNYSLGWIQQHRSSPYARIFAPALVWNSTADNEWKLAINWADTMGWNKLWTGGIYYESYDLTDVFDQYDIITTFDFSFVDDIVAGHIYDASNPIVAYDYNDDGFDDFSLGALAWCYDDAGWFDDEVLFKGFRSDGDAIGLYYDHGTHGTATAAHVAGAGVVTYYHSNSSEEFQTDAFTLEGIAPGATIQSARFITSGSGYGANLWVAGFSYNETTDQFYWTGEHQSHIVTNSWGWVTTPDSELNYLGLTWTILSTPEFFEYGVDKYPGVLQVCSAGNNGAGFMTIGPPGAAAGVLTVGASTTSHWLEYLYGPTQPHEGLASFTSKGPAFTGYVKPDVLAPGLAGYSVTPIYYQLMAEAWTGPWAGPISDLAYTLFAGTSQSAPVAAGVAALVWEAYDWGEHHGKNMYVKSIIQNTADDLGYDPASQGFGRINAEAACTLAADTSGLMFYTSDSWDIHAALMQDAWEWWGFLPASFIGTYVNETAMPYPTGVMDSSLFFGHVFPGDEVTINGSIYQGGGTQINYTAMNGWSMEAYVYVPQVVYYFHDTTFWYECNVTGEVAYGFYNLRDAIGAFDYDTSVGGSHYVTIGVSFDAADIAAAGAPWMFLYDWEDVDNDGFPGLWNATSGEGDELHRLTSASDPSNVNLMSWAVGTGMLSSELLGNLTIVIHDPAHDVDANFTGNAFNVTVWFWEKLDVTASFELDAGFGDDSLNITFTVPALAPGITQGFVEITAGTAGIVKLPMSVMVVANLTEAEGEVNFVADDSMGSLQPYSSEMYGCMEAGPKDYDFRSFVVHNPHATAGYLGVRVEWAQGGNNMHVAVINPVGSVLASGSAKTATTTAIIATLPDDPVGNYYIRVYALALNGTDGMPVPYNLTVMWYEDLTTQDYIFSYTANDVLTPVMIEDEDVIEGDHVLVNVSYPAFELPNMPEYEVVGTTIEFLSGIYVVRTGTLIIGDSAYDPFSGPIDLDEFVWEIVDGIVAGDTVKLTVDFTNSDCDIFAYWADTDNSTWTYGNNLVGAQMSTGAKPEKGQFVAGRSGAIAVGVYNYDLQPGSYEVIVDTLVGEAVAAVGPEVTYDTYNFLTNGIFTVKVSGVTQTNIAFETVYTELTFINFFAPEMGAVSVSGTGTTKTVTWSATDRNAGDDLYYELYVSPDGGTTYQLVAVNLTETTYLWDSSEFQERDTYRIRVLAFDNDPNENPSAGPDDYWPGMSDSAESAVFSAGGVAPPTTPTDTDTDTDTDTTTPPPDLPIDPLWIGLIGGIGVGVVVILILFLVKKK